VNFTNCAPQTCTDLIRLNATVTSILDRVLVLRQIKLVGQTSKSHYTGYHVGDLAQCCYRVRKRHLVGEYEGNMADIILQDDGELAQIS